VYSARLCDSALCTLMDGIDIPDTNATAAVDASLNVWIGWNKLENSTLTT